MLGKIGMEKSAETGSRVKKRTAHAPAFLSKRIAASLKIQMHAPAYSITLRQLAKGGLIPEDKIAYSHQDGIERRIYGGRRPPVSLRA